MPGITIRDLLYLDFNKAASIWSQFEEGLTERISVTDDTGKDRAAGTKFGIPGVAEANLGVDYLQKRSTLQSRTLHHDVLNRVERGLSESGLVTDLSEAVDAQEASVEVIRGAIGGRPYIRAAGRSVLEDYRRMLAISQQFNGIVDFLAKASQETAKKSPEFRQLQETVTTLQNNARTIQDRNQRAVQKAKLKELQLQLEEATRPTLTGIDAWLIDGVRLWISTFMSSRINFRIYPFPSCPSFQVLCNLKRECFVDDDLEHLLYGYGNRPNVSLAVFGLITSIPTQQPSSFDPMLEFDASSSLSEQAAFEKGFRGIFGGIEGLEAFVRFSRYPNLTVHPIAVYRSFPVAAQAG